MLYVQYAVAFIILMGVLVFVHELGHFLAARWNGIRCDVFAVGMGPRVMGWNHVTGFSFGKLPADIDLQGRTDYRIAAFPIGGYVKIVGMVDESMDTDYINHAPEPWEFRSKNTLQKTFVISAGVIMNIILAVVLFAGIALFHGDTRMVAVVGHLYPVDSTLLATGIRGGDSITSVNGRPVAFLDEADSVMKGLASSGKDAQLGVHRAGSEMQVTIPASLLAEFSKRPSSLPPPSCAVIADVTKDSPADSAGLRKGDTVVAIDGVRIADVGLFIETIKKSNGKERTIEVSRAGHLESHRVTPNKENQILASLGSSYYGPTRQVTYPLGESIEKGLSRTWEATAGTFALVGNLVTGQAKLKESVGGPGMIVVLAQRTLASGIPDFLALMALLSVSLACMNILPVPVLDGGHLVFILIEGIIRREVSLKVRMGFQQVGFALLMIFMAFILFNDFSRILGF